MQTVLITGATDGIGLALARLFRARGARLLLIGRRPLEVAEGIDAMFTSDTYIRADLARVAAADRIAEQLAAREIHSIDLVFHNAGVGAVGTLETQSAAQIDELVNVNLVAPILLTRALLPTVRRAGGLFVFVSSVVAGLPTPDYAVYGATKAALEGFVRNLRYEGEARAIIVRPAATRTGMHRKAGFDEARTRRFASAESAARAIARAADRGRSDRTLGVSGRLLYAAGRAMGGTVDLALRRSRGGGWPGAQHAPQAARHVVITGGASGIGLALARAYAASGSRVTTVDRVADGAVAWNEVQTDLRREFGWCTRLAPVDVLVHNAGISAVGRFERLPPHVLADVIAVNLTAPLQLTACLLRDGMLKRDATLAFVASLSHFVGYPGAAVYAATKDGLVHFSRSLGVLGHTLTIFPGPTRTDHARRYSVDNRRENRRMAPEALAARIVAAETQRRRRLVPGATARLAAVIGRLLPNVTGRAMRRALLTPLGEQILTE